MWWLENVFKYSWKVILLTFFTSAFLYLAYALGFSNWNDGSFQVNDLYLPGCILGAIVLFMLTRKRAIKEFEEKYPPEKKASDS
ncbi:hypothetical protein CEH05_08120 [Halobacillus halophilus]|nr:hypothetical protein [Halobacillus halophilus]ASF39081.1 hypothetical protein CEH05_08120 [Halobacillus halophilus]